MSATAESPRKTETPNRTLIVAVLVMTLAVVALGGAVLVVKLRPESQPTTAAERTLQSWQQAVEQDPESDINQTGLGLALLDLERASEARQAFEQAIRLNPKNWMANFQLALILRETDPARALVLFEASAKHAPSGNRAVILIAQGDFLLAQGDPKGAVEVYERSIADTSFIFDSHFGLAQAYEELGDEEAALAEYRAAGRFAPDDERIAAAIERLKGGN